MKAKGIYLVLAALLLLASVASWTHAAPPTIYDLGTLGGTSSFGYTVSASGHVAGSCTLVRPAAGVPWPT